MVRICPLRLILEELIENGRAVPKEIYRYYEISRPTSTKILSRLEKGGWVKLKVEKNAKVYETTEKFRRDKAKFRFMVKVLTLLGEKHEGFRDKG